MLRSSNGCCISVTDGAGSFPRCTVYYGYFFGYTVGELRYIRKVNGATDVLFSLLVPHREENTLQIAHGISFDTHVHVVPLTDFGQSRNVIVGYIHTTGISYFAVNHYDFPMISMHGMIDPWEGDRVKFHYFNAPVTDCFQVMFL